MKLTILVAFALGGMVLSGCDGDDAYSGPTITDGSVDVTNDVADARPDSEDPLPTSNVDRAGRPAVIFALVTDGLSDAGIDASKVGYNRLTSNDVLPIGYQSAFQKNLVRLDNVDGTSDWNGGAEDIKSPPFPHPLVSILSNDFLLVDTSKPFSESGFLEIEFNATKGTPGTHLTCGGRWFADDAIDKTMSYLVKKQLTGVSDNVSQATKPPTTTFPYLAPPN